MSEDVFKRYSAYYDLLYRDKDYAAEADYVARILRAADPNTRTILEFGSGTGRHGRLLVERGFGVFGIERSESMVESARARNLDCVQGDIQTAKVDRLFDAVIALFHVTSYQVMDQDVAATFANAARHLNRKGIFLFDVWHAPAVLTERPSVRVKRAEDETVRLIRIAEPTLDLDTKTVAVRYTMLAESKIDNRLDTFEEEHRMRYFSPSEIAEFADDSGFEVDRSEGFLTGRAPSENTWGVCYVLRKRG
jgi:SAM-dependent methyltransferase